MILSSGALSVREVEKCVYSTLPMYECAYVFVQTAIQRVCVRSEKGVHTDVASFEQDSFYSLVSNTSQIFRSAEVNVHDLVVQHCVAFIQAHSLSQFSSPT